MGSERGKDAQAVAFAERAASAKNIDPDERDGFVRGAAWIWSEGYAAALAQQRQAIASVLQVLPFAGIALLVYDRVGDWSFAGRVLTAMGRPLDPMTEDFAVIRGNIEEMLTAGWDAEAIGLALSPDLVNE